MDERSFFEYGRIELRSYEYEKRLVECSICMPCSLMQAISPHLLANGFIDNLAVRDPIAIWLPRISTERFVLPLQSQHAISDKIYAAMKEEVTRISQLFIHLQNYLIDPSDVIPMLPLGTYVTFGYRCSVDKVLNLLEGINSINVTGIPEVVYAFSSVLHEVLADFRKLDQPKRVLDI